MAGGKWVRGLPRQPELGMSTGDQRDVWWAKTSHMAKMLPTVLASWLLCCKASSLASLAGKTVRQTDTAYKAKTTKIHEYVFFIWWHWLPWATRVTCAGRPLGQLLGLPNTRPCDRGTVGAHTHQSENLERKSKDGVRVFSFFLSFFFRRNKITHLQPVHIQTLQGSWSTVFAWRKHLPSSHRWHRTGAAESAGGNY